MKNNLDLILNGPILKMICKLSLPNSITGISMVLIVISDAYFVSKLGNASLASLALVFPFITLMLVLLQKQLQTQSAANKRKNVSLAAKLKSCS